MNSKNAVIHLFENDNYATERRNVILLQLDKFLQSDTYTNIVSVAIRNQKDGDVIKISSIPKILQLIISCIGIIKLNGLMRSDLKYFFYGTLYSFIVAEDPNFFIEDFNIDVFQNLYSGIYEILEIAPEVLDIGTTMCGC